MARCKISFIELTRVVGMGWDLIVILSSKKSNQGGGFLRNCNHCICKGMKRFFVEGRKFYMLVLFST